MQKYPLAWPAGWRRLDAAQRTRAKFVTTSRQYSSTPGGGSWLNKNAIGIGAATTRVLEELRRFGVLDDDAVISTNLVLRLDGLPRADQRDPADPGVAVYWQRPAEGMKCMAIDRYDRVADNLAAIAATLDAMRAIERHGGAQILARAFTGFDALPAPGQTSAPGWRELLGFGPNDNVSRVALDTAYRVARSKAHPDKPGGDAGRFDAIQKAYDVAQQEVRA